MTETTTVSGANDHKDSVQDQSVSDSVDHKKQDQVAYDTYQRTLSEAKRYKSTTQELKAKLEQYEQEKLLAEGKKDEVISKLQKERDEMFGQLKKTKEEIAYTAIRNQVELKAKEFGCVSTDDLVKLVDFSGLDVGEGNKVSEQSLEVVLAKAKESKPYLFSKPAPNIHDGTPNTKVGNGKADFTKMSKQEIIAYAMKNNIK